MCMQSASPEAHGRLGLHKLPQSISLLLANISLTAYFFYLPKPFLSSPFFFFFFFFFSPFRVCCPKRRGAEITDSSLVPTTNSSAGWNFAYGR